MTPAPVALVTACVGGLATAAFQGALADPKIPQEMAQSGQKERPKPAALGPEVAQIVAFQQHQ